MLPHLRNANAPVQMKIILKDEIPVYQHPRRLPVCDQKTVDDQVQDWLAEKIIRIRIAGSFGVQQKREEETVL